MSDLSSMLVPLVGGHFPGWPNSEQPSVVQELLVLIGAPLAVAVVIGLLVLSGALIRRNRGSLVALKEPLWLGHSAPGRELTAGSTAGALTQGGQPIETTTGGASVRW